MMAYEDPKAFRPFTINKRSNAEMVNLILEYYLPKRALRLLDVTYGAGTFWKKKWDIWGLEAYDAEPLNGHCQKSSWRELEQHINGVYDAMFFDPPYTTAKSSFNLDMTEGYSGNDQSAAFTSHMKYGDGLLPLYLEKTLFSHVKRDGIVVFKCQELRIGFGYFELYDYLIQDHGWQPDGFKLSKPKARPNHAFWMVLTPK